MRDGGTMTEHVLPSTKWFFRLLTHTLKSCSCVALLDVVEKSSIGQNATTTSRSASAVADGVRPTNTAWNRGWSCGLVLPRPIPSSATRSKTRLPKRNVTNVENRLVLAPNGSCA